MLRTIAPFVYWHNETDPFVPSDALGAALDALLRQQRPADASALLATAPAMPATAPDVGEADGEVDDDDDDDDRGPCACGPLRGESLRRRACELTADPGWARYVHWKRLLLRACARPLAIDLGFGLLFSHAGPDLSARNPRTGEPFMLRPRRHLYFVASDSLLDDIAPRALRRAELAKLFAYPAEAGFPYVHLVGDELTESFATDVAALPDPDLVLGLPPFWAEIQAELARTGRSRLRPIGRLALRDIDGERSELDFGPRRQVLQLELESSLRDMHHDLAAEFGSAAPGH